MKLEPIAHKINCKTCNHELLKKSSASNVVVCSFCNTINWLKHEPKSGKTVSGSAKNLLSIFQIGTQIKDTLVQGEIIGFIELLVNDSYVLLYQLKDGNNHIHWLFERHGQLNWFDQINHKAIENAKITNPNAGKLFTLEVKGNFQNFMTAKATMLKRFDIFGEIWMTEELELQTKILEAYDEEGHCFFSFIFSSLHNLSFIGKRINIPISSIINPSFQLPG
jgi:LSD1 subclass zinc finger protein